MTRDKIFSSFMEEVALVPLCAVAHGHEDTFPYEEKEVRLHPGYSEDEYEAFVLSLRGFKYLDVTMWFEDQESHNTWLYWPDYQGGFYSGPTLISMPPIPKWAKGTELEETEKDIEAAIERQGLALATLVKKMLPPDVTRVRVVGGHGIMIYATIAGEEIESEDLIGVDWWETIYQVLLRYLGPSGDFILFDTDDIMIQG